MALQDPTIEHGRPARPVPAQLPFLLLAVLAVLNVVDVLTTRLVLAHGGAEGNPLMQPLVAGTWSAAGLKAACIAAVAALLLRSSRSARILTAVAMVDAWYLLVVVWNLSVLARL